MDMNDKLLIKISELSEKSLMKSNNEYGYYISKKDKNYRRHAITVLLDGLERENQNKAITFMANLLQLQSQINQNIIE